MLNTLQYPLERNRDIERRWQRLLQQTAPPRPCGDPYDAPRADERNGAEQSELSPFSRWRTKDKQQRHG